MGWKVFDCIFSCSQGVVVPGLPRSSTAVPLATWPKHLYQLFFLLSFDPFPLPKSELTDGEPRNLHLDRRSAFFFSSVRISVRSMYSARGWVSLLGTLIEGSRSVVTISFWRNKEIYMVNFYSPGGTFDRVVWSYEWQWSYGLFSVIMTDPSTTLAQVTTRVKFDHFTLMTTSVPLRTIVA